MNRRKFLKAAAGCVAAALLPPAGKVRAATSVLEAPVRLPPLVCNYSSVVRTARVRADGAAEYETFVGLTFDRRPATSEEARAATPAPVRDFFEPSHGFVREKTSVIVSLNGRGFNLEMVDRQKIKETGT